MSAAFAEIAAHIQARSGLALGPEKLYLLETRLAPIMRAEKINDLTALADRLHRRRDESLSRAVVQALTTNESLFFRDGSPFQHVKDALAKLHRARPKGQRLRLWSAAASFGQEAYSLAMTASEVPGLVEERGIEIVGTDISLSALDRARAGVYTQFEVQRGLSGPMLARWFTREADCWRAVPKLRAMATFREWNLLSELSPLGVFDIVFCRNVLIYFDIPTKERVLTAITRQMVADGLLYLGASETTLGVTRGLARIEGRSGVYSKVG